MLPNYCTKPELQFFSFVDTLQRMVGSLCRHPKPAMP
jgi:hypothetical protein